MLGTKQPLRNQNTFLTLNDYGCVLTAATRIANSIIGYEAYSSITANKVGRDYEIFLLDRSDKMWDITCLDGFASARLINMLLKKEGISQFVSFQGRFYEDFEKILHKYEMDDRKYYVTIRYEGGHTANLTKINIDGKIRYVPTDTSKKNYRSINYTKIEAIDIFKVIQKNGGERYYER